ncbi:MAG: YidC/Oxa1 family membrane protein insertase, partial [Lysobacterales bacterium]
RFGLFDFMGKIINQIIHLIYKVVPNWGVCILIMSVLIYFSMYPLTKKSMLSMKKMQSVAPKINAIKEKHKNDKQKLNAEMMDIYKREKINPIGGCLPVLFQMPIFLGLYQVLWRSVSFKGAKFLWIQDLTEPDRLMIFPFTMPVLGNELNILPLFMVVIMFFQQKFSSKNMITTDPMQKQQQQMMMYMMPLFLGFIFYKFSSGLTLYFTMFYLFSTITQWRMSRDVKVG